MNIFINLTNKRFTKLLVIKRVENDKWGAACWLCRCDCGNYKVVRGHNLKSEHTKSCGCLCGEAHDMRHTSEYYVWNNMKERCINSKRRDHKNYGGRGIKVCGRWLNSFIAFFKDMGKRPDPKYTLERINNDGNYESGNCKWATAKEQNGNTRRNRLFKAISPINRVYTSKNQSEFARQFNLCSTGINDCLNDRCEVHKGWAFIYL